MLVFQTSKAYIFNFNLFSAGKQAIGCDDWKKCRACVSSSNIPQSLAMTAITHHNLVVELKMISMTFLGGNTVVRFLQSAHFRCFLPGSAAQRAKLTKIDQNVATFLCPNYIPKVARSCKTSVLTRARARPY
jgi:hypothetical protein